jgi:hypothetical protein
MFDKSSTTDFAFIALLSPACFAMFYIKITVTVAFQPATHTIETLKAILLHLSHILGIKKEPGSYRSPGS